MKVNHSSHIFFIEQVSDSLIVRNYLYKQLLSEALKQKNITLSNSTLSSEGNVQHLNLDVYYNNKYIRKIKKKLRRIQRIRLFIKKKKFNNKKKNRRIRFFEKNFSLLKKKRLYLVPLKSFFKSREKEILKIKTKKNLKHIYNQKQFKSTDISLKKRNRYRVKRLRRLILFYNRFKSKILKYKLDKNKFTDLSIEKKRKLRVLKRIKKSILKKINRIKEISKFFFLTRLNKNDLKDLHIRINPLNKYLKKNFLFYQFIKNLSRYRFSLFRRGNTLLNDFIAISSLLNRKQITLDSFTNVLGLIFKTLHKRRHSIFFGFIRKIIQLFTKTRTSCIQGMKIEISGRLRGNNRARTQRAIAGFLGITTISSETKFSKCDVHTIYGVYGLKVWVTYGAFRKLTKKYLLKSRRKSINKFKYQKDLEKLIHKLEKIKEQKKTHDVPFRVELKIRNLLRKISNRKKNKRAKNKVNRR